MMLGDRVVVGDQMIPKPKYLGANDSREPDQVSRPTPEMRIYESLDFDISCLFSFFSPLEESFL